jgi:hypothetical protein
MFKNLKSNMEMKFITLILKRIKSKSPKFYVTIRWVSGVTAFVCGLILGVLKVYHFGIAPGTLSIVTGAADHIGALLSGAWGLSWTGTADPALLAETASTVA